jgi:hypothetical protein
MRQPRIAALCVIGFLAMISLVACSGSSSCQEAQRSLSNAQSIARDAESKAAVFRESNNPAGVVNAEADKADAEATAKEAQADIDRLKCNAADASSSAPGGSTTDTATVLEADGQQRDVPIVSDDGTVIHGDSTGDDRTPPTYSEVVSHGPAVSWQDLSLAMQDKTWYVQGVNDRKAMTGFNWSDVERFAATNVDARMIVVYGLDYSDQRARDAVRDLVGTAADTLPIVRRDTCIENTRGFEHNQMQDFLDCRKMVRVTLAAIEYNDDGSFKQLNPDRGVYVDCFNVHWKPGQVTHQPTTSSAPQTTTPTTTAAPTTTPPQVSTPSTTTPTRTTTPTTTPTPTSSTGKQHTQAPSGEPHVGGTGQVAQTTAASTTPAPQTVEDQPEVASPAPVNPTITSAPPATESYCTDDYGNGC